jgi:hypothetical protein
MKVTIIASLFIILTGTVHEVFAQRASVHIRQSFETAEKKGKPADFSFTLPDNGDDSFIIDGAIGLMIPVNSIQSLSPYIELHRNTQIEKEHFTAGYGAVYNTRFNTGLLVDANHYINLSVKWHEDREQDLNSFRARLRWSPFIIPILNPPFDWLLPTTDDWAYIGNNQNFHITHNIAAGFEHQENVNPDDELNNGSLSRFFGQYTLTLIPFADEFDEKVYFDLNLEQRWELRSSIETELKDSHTYFDISGNYIIAGTMNAAKAVLSVTRVYGENPWTGLRKQAFTKVSVKVKI